MKIIIAILPLMIILFACQKKEISENSGFERNSFMKLYFQNENGSRLFDLNDTSSFPVSFTGTFVPPTSYEKLGIDGYHYNYCDRLTFDYKKQDYYWTTLLGGIMNVEYSEKFVRLSGNDVDTISVYWRFERGGIDSGHSFPWVNKLLYNGIVIQSGEGTSTEFTPSKTIIRKQGGKTIITTQL
jgi:hypothetical protein